jgi:uncharacterized membrane protein YdjX (TVP38/TMEM64 family)
MLGGRTGVRWALSAALTLVVILLPFALVHESMDAWTLRQLQAQHGTLPIALLVVMLLIADLLLPVPSSVVSTLAGALLGFPAGFAASLVGMTLGCQLGYALGRRCGGPLARRWLSAEELARVSRQVDRRGVWAFAIMRPIPVLAEASAFWAGVMLVNPLRFSAVTLLANAGVSGVYAATGAAVLSSF